MCELPPESKLCLATGFPHSSTSLRKVLKSDPILKWVRHPGILQVHSAHECPKSCLLSPFSHWSTSFLYCWRQTHFLSLNLDTTNDGSKHNFPEQPLPIPHHSFREEIILNIQPELSLVQLEAIPSHAITVT